MTAVAGPRPLLPRDLLRACVHCGLCLPTCPTYDLLGDERDSPRGRIFQMKAAADGVVALDDPALRRHLDRCLGCRACETACPSGVQFGRALEEVRAVLPPASHQGEAIGALILDGLFASPRLLDVAGTALRAYHHLGLGRAARRAGLFSRLPPGLGNMEALLPTPQPFRSLPAHIPPRGEPRARVGLITGCVMRQFFSAANRATARVLAVNGAAVVTPGGQGCCGALHLHSGHRSMAQVLARKMIEAFPEDLDAIIVNAAGCGATLKEYGHLLAGNQVYAERAARFAARIRDVSEWLDQIGLRPPTTPVSIVVTYQDACHLRHGQRIHEAPRRLLRAIPGLDLVELPGAADCCGSAGIYNLTQPDLADRLQAQKIDKIRGTGARCLAVGNPGCAIQIAGGLRARGVRMAVVHPVELLDRAYGREREEAMPSTRSGTIEIGSKRTRGGVR
ncbi:MAG TPA: (Fe-S)-binding protein [Chloroflexota bacterium]|nr:(Fe-S)-binding protein [Chloroflexota bacterium]